MRSIKAIAIMALAVFMLGCASAPNVTPRYAVPLDDEIHNFTVNLCENHHINPAIIFAMMDVESDYNARAVGDYGQAFGLLQVQPQWHGERINRLECWDLYDPKNNVTVAVDYLVELLEKYDGNIEMALVAYNRGAYGAQRDLFSKGIYESEYSRKVLEEAQKLTEGAITNANT